MCITIMVTRTFHPLNTKLRSVETIEANLAVQKRKLQINLLNKLKLMLLLQINFQTEKSWRTTVKTFKQRKRFKRTRLICKTISEFAGITALGIAYKNGKISNAGSSQSV